jgi:hypothetical protein
MTAAGGVTAIVGQGDNVFDLAAHRRRREMSTEPWVKKERVADFFDVSTRTVYRWVHEGCPVKRLRGGTLRFQIGPLTDWLDSRSS